MSGVKHDQEKPDMSLISPYAMEAIAKVMTFGARKYNRDNWRGGLKYSRLIAAALRHISAFNKGEDKDPESGESHISHALCCLMMLSEFEQTRTDLDDRFKKAQAKDLPYLPPPTIVYAGLGPKPVNKGQP